MAREARKRQEEIGKPDRGELLDPAITDEEIYKRFKTQTTRNIVVDCAEGKMDAIEVLIEEFREAGFHVMSKILGLGNEDSIGRFNFNASMEDIVDEAFGRNEAIIVRRKKFAGKILIKLITSEKLITYGDAFNEVMNKFKGGQ